MKPVRRTSIAICLLLLISMLGSAAPASASASAGVDKFVLMTSSQPNDYIGLGGSTDYTAADGTFTISALHYNADAAVEIYFHTPNYSDYWRVWLSAPGPALVPGTYINATRYPFEQLNMPGMDITDQYRGCNAVTGSFRVLQVAYQPDGTISRFAATFVQYCQDLFGLTDNALQGAVYYNVPVTAQG